MHRFPWMYIRLEFGFCSYLQREWKRIREFNSASPMKFKRFLYTITSLLLNFPLVGIMRLKQRIAQMFGIYGGRVAHFQWEYIRRRGRSVFLSNAIVRLYVYVSKYVCITGIIKYSKRNFGQWLCAKDEQSESGQKQTTEQKKKNLNSNMNLTWFSFC